MTHELKILGLLAFVLIGLGSAATPVPPRHGHGTQTYNNSSTYVGDFKNGVPNGQGTLTFTDGRKYVGEYLNSLFHGTGTYTYSDGTTYVGEYRNGRANGQGTRTYPNGFTYSGQWKDGMRNGQGTFTKTVQIKMTKYPGSSFPAELIKKYPELNISKPFNTKDPIDIEIIRTEKYEGEWQDDQYHGQGVYTSSSGETRSGTWEKGRFISTNELAQREEDRISKMKAQQEALTRNQQEAEKRRLDAEARLRQEAEARLKEAERIRTRNIKPQLNTVD
jgi:hypothetical protein